MPCLRGIEVSLTTKPEDEQIPEYPHPEGTSARLLGALSSCSNGQLSQPKAGPTVAVYIPSIPGTPFSINYSVNTTPAAPCKFIFFRLYMNARPIAAWGIDPTVRSEGKVVKSLWSPCRLYTDQIGFEGRNFVFLPGQEFKSVAEEGGLIEIQVFRAKERRARAPKLEEFRFQENYGIASPSIGLLDQPQDACFYDWHLLDAKDSPFATFRLHYRSLQNLKRLNLIPPTELELLCSISPKVLRTIARAEAASGSLNNLLGEQSSLSGDCSADEAVFHDCRERREEADEDEQEEGTEFYFLKSPPERFPAVPSNSRVPQPSKALCDAPLKSYLQRPLPELPVGAHARRSRRSSVASAMSATLSITPSLQNYAEEDSFNPEEVEVGVAQLVQLAPSESTFSFVPVDEPNPADSSISDYEASPKSPGDFFPEEKLSPSRYLPTTGSGLERGMALFTSPKRAIFSTGARSRQSLPSEAHTHRELARLETTTSSESEWAVADSSPARASLAENRAPPRESTPQAIKRTGRALLAGLRKRKISGSPGKLAAMVLGREGPKVSEGGDGG